MSERIRRETVGPLLDAKQDINKAIQDEINLRNDWDAQRSKELQDTQAELQKLNLQRRG